MFHFSPAITIGIVAFIIILVAIIILAVCAKRKKKKRMAFYQPQVNPNMPPVIAHKVTVLSKHWASGAGFSVTFLIDQGHEFNITVTETQFAGIRESAHGTVLLQGGAFLSFNEE